MNEDKITISVNEEDVQNLINCYEKDIEYIKQLETNWKELKKWLEEERTKFSQSKYSAEYGLIIGFIMCALEKMQEIESGNNNV